MNDEAEFSAFVRARSAELQRIAWLLTGDWSTAEDLVQSALTKTWQRWESVQRRDAPEVYVRRVMVRTFLAWRRRRWVGEIAAGWLPDVASSDDLPTNLAQQDLVARALHQLPKQQRAVVVLRYYTDLSEQATAETLRCSVGTVKTHAFRALATLRSNPALRAGTTEGADNGHF
jgi:RNA polymerase sigma-70 factor (sigma-E family)